MLNKGKDLITFITENKLEEIEWKYSEEHNQIQFTVELHDKMWIEYVQYLDDPDSMNITLVEIIDGEEEFCYIEPDYALKLRGLK